MNPFKEIWFNTGRCLDYFLIKENRKAYIEELVWIQALFFGVLSFLETKNPLRSYYLILYPALSVLVMRFFVPWVLYKIGKFVNGRGTKEELRVIVSLSCIPYLLSTFYLSVALIIPGVHNYSNGGIDFIVWVFVWRVLIIGVAKVQRITYVFAIMNIILPSVFITVIYLLLR